MHGCGLTRDERISVNAGEIVGPQAIDWDKLCQGVVHNDLVDHFDRDHEAHIA